jgi:hypothetical protein
VDGRITAGMYSVLETARIVRTSVLRSFVFFTMQTPTGILHV